jgi:hypothetical protein
MELLVTPSVSLKSLEGTLRQWRLLELIILIVVLTVGQHTVTVLVVRALNGQVVIDGALLRRLDSL